MVITAGAVSLELPLDSSEADVRTRARNSSNRTSLYVFGRGYLPLGPIAAPII